MLTVDEFQKRQTPTELFLYIWFKFFIFQGLRVKWKVENPTSNEKDNMQLPFSKL